MTLKKKNLIKKKSVKINPQKNNLRVVAIYPLYIGEVLIDCFIYIYKYFHLF